MTCETDCVKSAQANVESPHNASVVSPTLTSKHSALGLDFLHTWNRSLWASRRSTRAEAAPQLHKSSQSFVIALLNRVNKATHLRALSYRAR